MPLNQCLWDTNCIRSLMHVCIIHPMLDLKTPSTVAISRVHTKLDYCNSLFQNIDTTQIGCPQAIQNAFSCGVSKSSNKTTSLLSSKHSTGFQLLVELNRKSYHFQTNSNTHNPLVFVMFTIQAIRSKRSSSPVKLLRPSVTKLPP